MATQKRKRSTRRKRTKSKSGRKLFSICMALLLVAIALLAVPHYYSSIKAAINSISLSPEAGNMPSDSSVADLMEVKAPEELSEQFVEYKGFSVSFNPKLRIPNYVVYELTKQEATGDEARAKSFDCDNDVEGCPQPFDYTRSGYDRGHMAPAGDMKWDYDAMHESFYMTNICPQKHALNGGGWKRLEEKVRDWAERDSAIIVITGPITSPGMSTIGPGIAVPPSFFKVLLAPFAKPMRGIAFIYKNEGGQKVIEKQAVSIDSVERATGFDFFYNLPDNLENKIESSSNYKEWNN